MGAPKKSVQIKATGSEKGAAHFRDVPQFADHLIVLRLDYVELRAEIVYNGPEEPVRKNIVGIEHGQRSISLSRLRKMGLHTKPEEKLQRLHL